MVWGGDQGRKGTHGYRVELYDGFRCSGDHLHDADRSELGEGLLYDRFLCSGFDAAHADGAALDVRSCFGSVSSGEAPASEGSLCDEHLVRNVLLNAGDTALGDRDGHVALLELVVVQRQTRLRRRLREGRVQLM